MIERRGETTLQSSKRPNLKRLSRESRVHLQGLLRDPRAAASSGPGIDALCSLFMVFLPSGPVLALSFFVAKLGSHIRTPAHARGGVRDGTGCGGVFTPQLSWDHFGRRSGARKEGMGVPQWLGAE